MFSIKESFADCLECKLCNATSCILETNCKYIEDVDIVFVAENPGKDECSSNPPKPLIGKAGQVFRKYFKLFDINKKNYLLTNVVLCQTILPNGNTGNPDEDVIERCKVNCFNIIERCKPKLIVLMGASPAKAFGLLPKGTGILGLRGNMTKWKDYDVLLTFHPSFIARGHREEEDKFKDDLQKAAEFLNGSGKKSTSNAQVTGKNGVFYYKIPDKFYTSDFKLIDVQYLNKTNEVLFIFRDKNNKKIYHKENDTFICYQYKDKNNAKLTMPYDQLSQVRTTFRHRTSLDPTITYEGDIKLNNKHAQDYFLQRKEEESIKFLNTLFLDIETYTDTKENSSVEDANDPICIIGYYYAGFHKTYTLDPSVLVKNNPKNITISEGIEICKSEKELITKFISDVKKIDPDIITGWYSDGFDIPYIYYRSKKIGIDPTSLSKYGEVDIDLKYGRVHIAGIVVTDMLFLYRSFTFGLKESYSLDFIANLELGEGKLGKGYNFSEMFREDPDQAIRYNQQDVIILPKLDDKLNHIMFQDEIKKICKTTYDGVKSSMARLDSLLVTFLKERGIASKNANITEKDHKFEGAYVKEPIVGLHEYMVDFDFSSLYPSLILTYNIGVNTFAMKFDDYKLGYDFCYDRNNLPDKATIIIDPMFEAKKVSMSKEDIIKTVEENNLICTINGCFYKQHSQEVSYYSQILDSLLKSRKTYKKLMFDAQQSKDDINNKLYDTKQQVYKVIANSLYGILGNNAYRFFNIDCARSITLSGQEALKTSIIETDPFVTSLQKKEYKRPKPLSREEMFTENIERNIENIVTGDTDSIFITYEKIIDNKQSEEEILNLVNKWNELVHNFLNNKIIPEVVKRHNASLDTNRLELKNELVIKRGLFLAKKRYALYVISNEGKKVDKLKPMGIETRRRDFPSLTKDKLNELLDLVLKSKQLKIPNIMKYIDETKNIFIQEIKNGNKQIARPVTFGKKEDDYTVIPQGVKGMLNWNNLEYKAFGPGSHGYLFKIQGIDLEKAPKEVVDNYNKHYSTTGKKIEEIVIPENILRLPEYYIVDVKHILKFSWIDRYSLLLEPILPKQKTLLVF